MLDPVLKFKVAGEVVSGTKNWLDEDFDCETVTWVVKCSDDGGCNIEANTLKLTNCSLSSESG